jgi:pSer/pThr/pTyr-binding forkhead associated (FHA) protein
VSLEAPWFSGVVRGKGVVPVTTHLGAAVPRLVVLSPEVIRGRQIELAADYLTVGREPTCDVCLDDPHVSRTHAALERRDGTVYVQDLGSSGGTFVNGNPAKSAELHQGDVVTFATVRARFEAAPSVSAETQAMPTQAAPPPARATVSPNWSGEPLGRTPRAERAPDAAAHAGPVRYEIGQQEAQVISNVGRDQYNAQVQQVIQRRDSFMREIAGTKTKARWLVWLGLLLFVVGFAMFAAADLNLMKQISSDFGSNGSPAPPTDPFGRPILGIPSGLLGWAIGAIGALMLVIGIVLHIVATSRRRRVERDYPLPMPWPPNMPPGSAR